MARASKGEVPDEATECVAWAIVQAIRLWSNERYADFLLVRRRKPIDAEWLEWFFAEWRVARNVSTRHRPALLRYLNGRYRKQVMSDPTGCVVTRAARHMRRRHWTHGTTISLASKVAFLYRPSQYPPLDSYGRKGINRLSGRLDSSERTSLPLATYEEYLCEFNHLYRRWQPSIEHELGQRWVATLAGKLGCPAKALGKRAFKRKVLDNILMIVGGREGRW